MASLITANYLTIGLSLLNSGLNYLISLLYKLAGSKSAKGIVIAYPEANLLNTLSSTNTSLINLDTETANILTQDDKAVLKTGNLLNSKVFYIKSKLVMQELQDIHANTSNAIDSFVFYSTDYKLLKHSGISDITYTLPSETYHQQLMNTIGWDEKNFVQIKNEIMLRKYNKIMIYNSFSELQQILIKQFGFTIKI